MAALGAIGAATAYTLGQRRKRKEEEARQTAEAAAEAARRNAAEAARRVQNWLQGQATLQNALNNSALSDAEKQGVQSTPKNRSVPDPETADMTEKERLSLYRQSERYRAYQERMQAWEAERKRHKPPQPIRRIARASGRSCRKHQLPPPALLQLPAIHLLQVGRLPW